MSGMCKTEDCHMWEPFWNSAAMPQGPSTSKNLDFLHLFWSEVVFQVKATLRRFTPCGACACPWLLLCRWCFCGSCSSWARSRLLMVKQPDHVRNISLEIIRTRWTDLRRTWSWRVSFGSGLNMEGTICDMSVREKCAWFHWMGWWLLRQSLNVSKFFFNSQRLEMGDCGARASHRSPTCTCDASCLESLKKRICKDLQRHQGSVKTSQPPCEAGGFWMAASGHCFLASKQEQKRRGEFKIPSWHSPPEQLVFFGVATSNLRVEYRFAIPGPRYL